MNEEKNRSLTSSISSSENQNMKKRISERKYKENKFTA